MQEVSEKKVCMTVMLFVLLFVARLYHRNVLNELTLSSAPFQFP